MKNTVKTMAFGVITFTMVACASQKNQTGNNQKSSGQQGGPQQMGTKGGQQSEVNGPLVNDFSKVDTDSDGFISESEFKNAPRPQRNGRQ